MKNIARTTLITAALVLMTLSAAYAQKTAATVNIPFTFTVDDVRMPAGEYTISSTSERVVTLQRVGGPEVKTTVTNNGSSTKSDGRAKLVFHKYGDAYFVAAAWMPKSDHPQEFFTSASEIEVARTTPQKSYELAMNVAK